MVCNCKKTKCATKQCSCVKSGTACDDECGCLSCENMAGCSAARYSSESSESDTDQELTLNELASIITEQVRVSVTRKREDVFEFRNNLDMYTNQKK